MKRHIMVGMTAAFLAVVCAFPAFAHCHGRSRYQSQYHYDTCQAYCDDGYLCGQDGHYCGDHRNGDTCATGDYCQPTYHGRHHH